MPTATPAWKRSEQYVAAGAGRSLGIVGYDRDSLAQRLIRHVFLSLLALRQRPFAPSGFRRLSSLLWAPPTPSPSSPQCYCLPLQALQLDPSLGWASQIPDCSFRARCPTIPRKVPVGVSVIFSPPGCWLPFPRGSWPLSSFLVSRLSYAGSLSLRLALSLSRGSKRPVSQPPALAASCLMTLYMANSFHLARTTKLPLALRRRARGRLLNFRV